ncbi:MAG: hypothetical protein E7324_07715 [Clostridiales bacterium]|nr:hypothetical protein [Clostridiales bacterium]
MKRAFALLLLLTLLPLSGAFCLEVEEALPHLYSGKMRLSAKVFADWNGTEGINHINTIPQGVWVKIHALNPTFALVTYESGRITGYVKRVCIEQIRTINSTDTPPYGVEFNGFLAVVGAQDAPVCTLPGAGDTLITLHKGAKVSFIGFEGGYAKIIYHRQYAYIDSNHLTDVTPVHYYPEAAGPDTPIASYTSFYKITTDESNLNRMHNIATACEKLCAIQLKENENLNFNRDIGPYRASNGYKKAGALVDGELTQGYGGGTCQVSSTLYNVVLQLPGLHVLQRRAHGDNGASYLPIGVDAAVGNSELNFRFRNDYPFPVRIVASSQDGALTIAIYKAKE